MSPAATTTERLREEARRIIDSGALGRSSSYARLLTYLVECTAGGRAPKEIEIAIEVFGKGLDFEPTQDAMVRVYVHNLRQKLNAFYARTGGIGPGLLTLPRGEYRVQLGGDAPAPEQLAEIALPSSSAESLAARGQAQTPLTRRWPLNLRMLAAAAALLACGVVLGIALASLRTPLPSPTAAVAASRVWAPFFDDDLPVLVVVGDYYIFGERDADGDVARLVRDFGINSGKDLDDLMLYDGAARGRYVDLNLTYLPAGSAFALRDILRVAHTAQKTIRVASMSELSAAELKTGHVLYLGYVSALGMLEDFVFSSSGLEVGYNYDELRNRTTGAVYSSEAGIPGTQRNYRDYGLVSTFPGPNGNQFLVVAGTRDAGLMQAAHVLADPMFIGDIESAAPQSAGQSAAPAFELLYEVTGYGRTNLDAMLVHSSELRYREIWGGELRHEAH